MPCEQPPGLPEELPDDPAALKAIIADLELSNAALREVLAVLKAGAPALTNAEAAGCASRLEGAFGAAVLALPQNQPNAPLYPAGGAPGSRPGALPHFGRPRYLGPPPRARSTAG